MKCVFEPPSAVTCQRCQENGKHCFVQGRRGGHIRHVFTYLRAIWLIYHSQIERFLRQLEQKQDIIDGLLRVVSNSRNDDLQPSDAAETWKWIEPTARPPMDKSQVGAVNIEYFRRQYISHHYLRRIIMERRMLPEILMADVVTNVDDVKHLFKM